MSSTVIDDIRFLSSIFLKSIKIFPFLVCLAQRGWARWAPFIDAIITGILSNFINFAVENIISSVFPSQLRRPSGNIPITLFSFFFLIIVLIVEEVRINLTFGIASA